MNARPRAAAACPTRGNDPVGELDVECDQKGVQVGDHEGLQGLTCVNTPILDTLRLFVVDQPGVSPHHLTCTEIPANDLV
jgi:hypothetical protein